MSGKQYIDDIRKAAEDTLSLAETLAEVWGRQIFSGDHTEKT